MIELKNFEKSYGKFLAVKPTSFTVKKGEVFGLLGPNGSGKSTIIRAIVGLIFPTRGTVQINGQQAWNGGKKIREMISYMPQRITMPDNLRAREIVKFYADLRHQSSDKINEVMKFARLNGHSDKFVREFSGGLLQRLGLAIAFISSTPILIMDEPTLNLDPRGMRQFREFIHERKKAGTTIIFASHILADAEELADRVGIMVNGELVKIESVETLREEIQNRSTVLVRIPNHRETFLETAVEAGAESAWFEDGHLRFIAAPDMRLKVIRSLESAGATVGQFATRQPGLDTLIMEHFGEED